jgi:hypothetical protein
VLSGRGLCYGSFTSDLIRRPGIQGEKIDWFRNTDRKLYERTLLGNRNEVSTTVFKVDFREELEQIQTRLQYR